MSEKKNKEVQSVKGGLLLETEKQRKKSLLESGLFCILLLLAGSVAGGMWGCLVSKPGNLFKWLLLCVIFICCVLVVYWKYTGALTEEKLLVLLFLLAFAARLCYVLNISITSYQHDTSYFGKTENNYGHTGYIRYLMEEGHLPDFNVIGKSQFYHPPLHHIVAAFWMKLQLAVNIPFDTAAENIQILTLFYSMVALYAAFRILRLLNIKGTPLLAALCLFAFHPTFFLLSGSINNDCMSVMFALLAVWAALEWMEKQTFPRIIALACCIGCAMLAKLATGVIAPAVAFLFLYRLCTVKGGKQKGMLFLQFFVFGLICIPLGIGWQVRNAVLFDVPLTYVPKLSVNADQYLGGFSTVQRFFDFGSLTDFGVYPMRTGVQGALYFEHCIPLAILKMSLFGEYSVWKDVGLYDAVATLLFWINVLLVLAFLGGIVYSIYHAVRKKDGCTFYERFGFGRAVLTFLVLYWVCMMGSYVLFCFEYPHFCSMDFRYIVPTLLIGAVFYGVLLRRLGESSRRAAVITRSVLIVCACVFAVCSAAIYPLALG